MSARLSAEPADLVALRFAGEPSLPKCCADCGARRQLVRLVAGRLVPARRVRLKPGRVYMTAISHEPDCPRFSEDVA